ncbi:type VI secretion system lipoprotein TssJ [Moritella sp. PE36]|uniref:type VI secretion system lipoprotein TssJ n=1 Tax=Moritella sp. PE36 TaxID=58051 RepID=UPI001E5F582B|nr:type VI secretion system lipoprotein TssJ [Moritella sp. PE36]
MILFTPFLCAMLKRAKVLTTTVTLLLLTACSSTDVRLNLSASADLNSNNHNEALPVIVRVYQLADVKTFRNASFDQLWKADELILGSDLVDKTELTVKPNAKLDYEFVQADGANYIALFAMFRNVEASNWRWLHKLNSGALSFDTEFDIQLLNNKIYYLDN